MVRSNRHRLSCPVCEQGRGHTEKKYLLVKVLGTTNDSYLLLRVCNAIVKLTETCMFNTVVFLLTMKRVDSSFFEFIEKGTHIGKTFHVRDITRFIARAQVTCHTTAKNRSIFMRQATTDV